jgi:branched-chain amino acid transport system substrate-binding protein
MILRRRLTIGIAAVLGASAIAPGFAQETLRIGLIMPMTGQLGYVGQQMNAGVQLYLQQNGTMIAGRQIEIILKDDGAVPDVTKQLAQELIVNQKVAAIAGFAITPSALSAAAVATEARVPEIVMLAGTSIITEKSAYVVRTSSTLAQSSQILGDWAAKNGIRRVVSIVSDYAPGVDSENSFKQSFATGGGEIIEALRVPLQNPDFAPFLQRARDDRPDAIFVFTPSGKVTFAKQFAERGLDNAGIRLLCTGDVTDDDQLNAMGDAMIGTVSAHNYSAAHPSALNKAYVAAFRAANKGLRPNFISVAGYDGMHLLYEALKKTGGGTDGDALIGAMKGMAWESPRGPISIDPETRDIVQNIYVRKVEKVDGELYNVEFATFEAVKDPIKAAQK